MEKRGRGGELFQLDEVGAEGVNSFTALLPHPPWTSSSPTSTMLKQEPDQLVDALTTTNMDEVQEDEEPEAALDMPPGFRFKPTDSEVIYYLEEKCADGKFRARAITEIDINNCEPWDLPNLAKMGEKEWYFFWEREHKYPTGSRTNRATLSGYWKATGKDKEIYRKVDKGGGSSSKSSNPVRCLVGMKKTLVFYLGRAPKGTKTNWVMHEYRRIPNAHSQLAAVTTTNGKKDWVVCRVFHKTTPEASSTAPPTNDPSNVQSPHLVPLQQRQTFLPPPTHNYNPNYRYPSSTASELHLVSPTLPPLLDYPSHTTPYTTTITTSSVMAPPIPLYDYGSTGPQPYQPYYFPSVTEDVGLRTMLTSSLSTATALAPSSLLRGKCKAELNEYMTALQDAATSSRPFNAALPLQEHARTCSTGYDDGGDGLSSPCSSSDAPLAGLDTMWNDFNAVGSTDS